MQSSGCCSQLAEQSGGFSDESDAHGNCEIFISVGVAIRIRSRPQTEICVSTVPKKQANPIDAQVGNRVRLRRMLIGMSQERLGELLGLTFQQVQKYEKGVNRI